MPPLEPLINHQKTTNKLRDYTSQATTTRENEKPPILHRNSGMLRRYLFLGQHHVTIYKRRNHSNLSLLFQIPKRAFFFSNFSLSFFFFRHHFCERVLFTPLLRAFFWVHNESYCVCIAHFGCLSRAGPSSGRKTRQMVR